MIALSLVWSGLDSMAGNFLQGNLSRSVKLLTGIWF